MSSPIDISVVIPVYNSHDCLAVLAEQLCATLEQLSRGYEIILVNDGSTDSSWDIVKTLAEEISSITGVSLRKNFGQDNAIMAGLSRARGSFTVIMDDDLQHDPKYLPQFLAEIEKGYDVVYGKFKVKKQKAWKNLGSWFNGHVATWVLKKPRDIYLSPYKIIRADIVKEIIKYQGAYPYVDGLLFRVTSNFSEIDIEHQPRYSGHGHFNLIKSVLVWSNLATAYSVLPLRLATWIGMITAIGGFVLSAIFLGYRLLHPDIQVGWASTILVILVLGGVQLFALGIIGEYVGRTYLSINKQPQFTIAQCTAPEANE